MKLLLVFAATLASISAAPALTIEIQAGERSTAHYSGRYPLHALEGDGECHPYFDYCYPKEEDDKCCGDLVCVPDAREMDVLGMCMETDKTSTAVNIEIQDGGPAHHSAKRPIHGSAKEQKSSHN
ncbi:MAG: hypothetical protein Q9226_007973 [Calogaya cf. arnoldii]